MTILADNGYHKNKVESEIEKNVSKITGENRDQNNIKTRKNLDYNGFKPVHKRWVIERSNA